MVTVANLPPSEKCGRTEGERKKERFRARKIEEGGGTDTQFIRGLLVRFSKLKAAYCRRKSDNGKMKNN